VSSAGSLDPVTESRVRAGFTAQTMLATLGATMADVAPGRG
jgi:hypothetical protein